MGCWIRLDQDISGQTAALIPLSAKTEYLFRKFRNTNVGLAIV
jgi:hypothetical protein